MKLEVVNVKVEKRHAEPSNGGFSACNYVTQLTNVI